MPSGTCATGPPARPAPTAGRCPRAARRRGAHGRCTRCRTAPSGPAAQNALCSVEQRRQPTLDVLCASVHCRGTLYSVQLAALASACMKGPAAFTKSQLAGGTCPAGKRVTGLQETSVSRVPSLTDLKLPNQPDGQHGLPPVARLLVRRDVLHLRLTTDVVRPLLCRHVPAARGATSP